MIIIVITLYLMCVLLTRHPQQVITIRRLLNLILQAILHVAFVNDFRLGWCCSCIILTFENESDNIVSRVLHTNCFQLLTIQLLHIHYIPYWYTSDLDVLWRWLSKKFQKLINVFRLLWVARVFFNQFAII